METVTPPAAPPAVAPSATPPVTAPTPPAAPSAPATKADLIRMATESMNANDQAAPVPPTPTAPVPTGLESPPAVPAPGDVPTGTPPVQTPGVTPDADIEPTAEEKSTLGEAGINALRNERKQSKEAREKLRLAEEELAELKKPKTPPTDPVTPPIPAAPRAPVTRLDHCETPAQVDACSMQAANQQALAMELTNLLNTEGLPAVVERFKADGVEKIGTVPVETVTAPMMSKFLSDRFLQSVTIQQQAPARKEYIAGQLNSYRTAVTVLPGLADKNSPERKVFDAFVAANPLVRNFGPNWPEMVAYGIAGTKAATTAKAPPAPTVPPAIPVPPPTPAPRPAPGAPARVTPVVPATQNNELEALRVKISAGKASKQDMIRYGALSMSN